MKLHIESTHPGLDHPVNDELDPNGDDSRLITRDPTLSMFWRALSVGMWTAVAIEHPDGTVCRYTAVEAP